MGSVFNRGHISFTLHTSFNNQCQYLQNWKSTDCTENNKITLWNRKQLHFPLKLKANFKPIFDFVTSQSQCGHCYGDPLWFQRPH